MIVEASDKDEGERIVRVRACEGGSLLLFARKAEFNQNLCLTDLQKKDPVELWKEVGWVVNNTPGGKPYSFRRIINFHSYIFALPWDHDVFSWSRITASAEDLEHRLSSMEFNHRKHPTVVGWQVGQLVVVHTEPEIEKRPRKKRMTPAWVGRDEPLGEDEGWVKYLKASFLMFGHSEFPSKVYPDMVCASSADYFFPDYGGKCFVDLDLYEMLRTLQQFETEKTGSVETHNVEMEAPIA